MSDTKTLLNQAVILLAQAAESIKDGGELTANRQDALAALNNLVCAVEDEIVPTVEVL